MTSLQHRLLLGLHKGVQLSEELYEYSGASEAHTRRVLIAMIDAGWVAPGAPVKRDTGQGRPLNSYILLDLGESALADYEATLEAIR